MSRKVIWFNGWFSALAKTIQDLKNIFGDSLYIIATNPSKDCVYGKMADYFEVEPAKLMTDAYVEYALDFCKKHNVDMFMPKSYAMAIAEQADRFEDIGVVLGCNRYDILNSFTSKSKIYEYLTSLNYKNIPEYKIIEGSELGIEYINSLIQRGEVPCMKFDEDEGAASFRVISNDVLNYESMYYTLENTISINQYVELICSMRNADIGRKIMLMPKLLSPEVSIDCCVTSEFGLIAVPRFKLGNRIKEIRLDENLIEHASMIHKIFNFNAPFNVQYRWTADGDFKLLEINPRMSGGIHLSNMCGCNQIAVFIGEALGLPHCQDVKNMHNTRLTQYETPVILE